ncbi:zinc-binding dehydrogenase [Geodermatophilus sp. TF02-6]|uniref:zinc-binding dehydrogenase n=1 Tax=Geodermatophilus sp. TF02-6 TaxID=2250575 RepID=UPI0018F7329D|nr:zinc-binding dehydrogenase [Geodermatophilus sp. TF02-6]
MAGAQEVVDYRDPDVGDGIRSAVPDGVDLYWDTSGHSDPGAALAVLAHGGRIVLSAGMQAHPELPVGATYTRDATLVGFAISNATVDDLAEAAGAINQRLADGTLTTRISDVLPLDRAGEAHGRLERGTTSGTRLVLRP